MDSSFGDILSGFTKILGSCSSFDNTGSGSSSTSLVLGLRSLFNGGVSSGSDSGNSLWRAVQRKYTVRLITTKVTGYPTQPPNHSSYETKSQSYMPPATKSDRTNSPEARTVQYGWNVHK